MPDSYLYLESLKRDSAVLCLLTRSLKGWGLGLTMMTGYSAFALLK